MRKIEPEFITGMGYIGASPGVLYHMGGAGEQTVVTGNPALLEGVKGSRFTSFTLHGKSTQGSTTGANLLPFEMGQKGDGFEVFADGVQIGVSKKTDFYAVGRNDFTNESAYDEFALMTAGEYYVYSGNADVALYVVAWRNGRNLTLGYSNGDVKKIEVMDGDKFRIILRTAGAFNGKVKAMISKIQPTTANYEPYTGGKPSPSPEYPRPIVSSGDDGSIGLDITGANLINASSIKSEEKLGVKLTNNGDGSFTFKGTTAESYFVTTYNYLTNLVPGEYAFALDGAKNVQACIRYTKNGVNRSWMADSKLSFDGSETNIFFYMQVKPNTTVNETVFPMLNVGSVFLDSEEYKEQFVSIPTSGGLPGIPVSSGGNYTDEKGQQWVCDEVDFKKGVYVQRIGKKTITSKDAFFKSGLSTNDVNYFALNNFPVHIGTAGKKDVLMSNCFVAGIYQNFGALGKIFLGGASGNVIYFSVNAQKYPDVETFKQWAVENGLMLLYQLADIVETHLTAEELSAYKTLRTYSPTTTVANDAEAGMSVGYKRRK